MSVIAYAGNGHDTMFKETTGIHPSIAPSALFELTAIFRLNARPFCVDCQFRLLEAVLLNRPALAFE
jgi:hypothetical protein